MLRKTRTRTRKSDCSPPVQTELSGSSSLKGLRARASSASTLGAQASPVPSRCCWSLPLSPPPLLHRPPLPPPPVEAAALARPFRSSAEPEKEPLLVSELLEYPLCVPDFFPPPPPPPAAPDDVAPSAACRLDLVVESLLSSELASLPESMEEFFLAFPAANEDEASPAAPAPAATSPHPSSPSASSRFLKNISERPQ